MKNKVVLRTENLSSAEIRRIIQHQMTYIRSENRVQNVEITLTCRRLHHT